METDRPYHHGDLRRVVIETAECMLNETRSWQFTLREVARRAGVSHAAPYRHFPDKAALLSELALRGFDQLAVSLTRAITGGGSSVRTQFVAVANAYIAFGTAYPGQYRLMFSAEAGKKEDIHLDRRAMAGLDVLVSLLERGQKENVFKRVPLPGLAAGCWAQVHGLTMLAMDGLLLPEKVGADPIANALEILLVGVDA